MIEKSQTFGVLFGLLFLAGCGVNGGPIITEDTFSDHKIRYDGEREDTEELSLKVSEALKQNAQTATLQLQVSTYKKGHIKISGFVNSMTQRDEVDRVGREVIGVRHVVNAVFVR